MTKLLTLWLVFATPTQKCIEADAKANSKIYIDATTQQAQSVRISQEPAPTEKTFSVFSEKRPEVDDQGGCYEVFIGKVEVKAKKVVKPTPKAEKAKK